MVRFTLEIKILLLEKTNFIHKIKPTTASQIIKMIKKKKIILLTENIVIDHKNNIEIISKLINKIKKFFFISSLKNKIRNKIINFRFY